MKTKKKTLKIAGIILAAAVVVFCIASPIVVQVLMNDTFARTAPPEPGLTSSILYEDIADRYDREPVEFFNRENRLTGHLYGAGNPEGLVVIISSQLRGHKPSTNIALSSRLQARLTAG